MYNHEGDIITERFWNSIKDRLKIQNGNLHVNAT